MTIWAPPTAMVPVLALAFLTAGCERGRADPASPPVAPAPQAKVPVVTATPSTLSRADILDAINKAATDYADSRPADTALVGRAFAIRLPFGCAGPTPDAAGQSAGLATWGWSKDRTSIRLTVTPADWTRSPFVLSPGAEPTWDGVEGFWIERPWSNLEQCPKAQAPQPSAPDSGAAGEVARSPMSAGLAAILKTQGSRLGRRDGGAYSFVVRGEGEAPPPLPLNGYRLVLEGRIGAFPDGAPIRCTASNSDRRPVCLLAVEYDIIAFEDAAGARLGEWRPT